MKRVDPADDKTSLGAVLIAKGVITQEEVDAAAKEGKKSGLLLGKVLIYLGGDGADFPKLSQHQIDEALAHQDDKRTPPLRIWRRVGAAIRAINAAINGMKEAGRTYVDGADQARRITMNDDDK